MKKILISVLFLVAIVAGLDSFSQQSKRDLEKKREKLLKEIEQTNAELKRTEKNKNVTKTQIDNLKKKIRLRNDLIYTINSEIQSLNGEITKTSRTIESLEKQMQLLRANYADMILFAQKNQNKYQAMMYVFAADDFNQAYKRMKYLQQYNQYRRMQADQITATETELTGKKKELQQKKSQKTGLRNTEEKNKKELLTEKEEHDKMMKNLQANEKNLQKQLTEKLKAKEKLDRAIEKIVRREIESAKKKAVASGKKNVTNENVFTLTPEAQKLSSSFSSNKGSLPWPVEQGRISETFGEHAHPYLKNVTTKNDGINIRTAKGSNIRSVFNGEVTGTVNLPTGSAIIIRHGEFLSVYSNVEDVFVKKGEKVTTKQRIGTIKTDSQSGQAELNLQIWKGFTKLNPQLWLARK